MLPNGLPHSARIHLQRDFERIMQRNAKYQNSGLSLWCREAPLNRPARFAVVVSKKLGTAVVRNRTKRLLREAFRVSRFRIKDGADIIVKPLSSERISTLHAALDALKSLCGKAAVLK